MIGRIIKHISDDYTVYMNHQSYVCKSRGKFRNLGIRPLVGDWVEFDNEQKIITEVKPRRNELIRPAIANIDQAIIITSVKHPDFSTNLLDKLLTIIEYNNVKPVICLTKRDLLTETENQKISVYQSYYQSLGYDVFDNQHPEQIKPIFKDNISVFTGQTGAGKSTLLNTLDTSLSIKTNEISYALGRGKHTTRHVELLPVCGGWIADTPGFSAIDFHDMNVADIRDQFVEFNEYKEECKYKDCLHQKEDQCAIKQQVESGTILLSRYENYLKFIAKE